MPVTISQISNTQSFGTWLARTNQMAAVISTNAVTTAVTAVGAVTTGNATVNGYFGSNTLFATYELRGGNVTTSNTLSITSNTLHLGANSANLMLVTSNSSTSNAFVNVVTVEIHSSNTLAHSNNTTINATSTVNIQTGTLSANASQFTYIGNTAFKASNTVTMIATNTAALDLTANLYQAKIYANVIVSGTNMNVTSNTLLTNKLGVNGAVTIANSMSVSNNVTVGGYINVSGAANVGDAMGVAGITTIANNLIVSGSANVSGAANVAGTLGVNGAVTIANTLNVTGSANVIGSVGVNGAVTIANTLNVTGSANVVGAVGVNGAVTIANTINVTSNANVGGTLGVNSSANIGGAVGVNGAVTIANTLDVTESANVGGTLFVVNSAVFANTLSVRGSINGNNNLNIVGSANVSTGINVGANVRSTTSNFTVGNSSSNSAITQTRISVGNSSVNTVITQNSLDVDGTADILGAANFQNTVNVTGFADFANVVTIANSASVGGLLTVYQANVTSDMAVRGNLTVNGNLAYTGSAIGDIVPLTNAYSLGNTTNRWALYGITIEASNGISSVTGSNSNFYSGTLFIDSTNNRVGIGNTTPSNKLVVAGNVEFTSSGGMRFSDGTFQNTATLVAGSNTQVQYSNGSKLAASSGFTFDVTSNTVTVANTIASNNQSINSLVISTAKNFNFTGTSSVTIDSFLASSFRSAEYTVQIKNSSSGTYQLSKLLVVHNGTDAQVTEYGVINTGPTNMGVFTAAISGVNVVVNCTPSNSSSIATIYRTLISA